MTIHLPQELERFVHDQVQAGRYRNEEDVIRDAVERLRKQVPPISPGPGSIGAMSDDAEVLDQVVEHAMRLREERPWRLGEGE